MRYNMHHGHHRRPSIVPGFNCTPACVDGYAPSEGSFYCPVPGSEVRKEAVPCFYVATFFNSGYVTPFHS